MNYELKLSLFQNLKSYLSKQVDLQEIVRLIRYDDAVRNKTELYRTTARTVTRDEANKKVKDSIMPCFSVAVTFNGAGKQATHVTSFTGLAFCDIDHVENLEESFRQVAADPHALLVYRTISGEGLRVIYRYVCRTLDVPSSGGDWGDAPPSNGTHYRAAYEKGNRHFAQLAGCDYDGQCGNFNRLSGLAHDPDVYVNLEAEPFTVTSEEAAEANLRPEDEAGKMRRLYPAGTQETTAETAWAVIEPMLAKRGVDYQPHHHHDYVMHASCLFNRFGTPQEDFLAWAAQQWADYDRQDRESCIRWVYSHRAAEHGTYRIGKSGRKGEVSMITISEICQWLTQHRIELCYNAVTDMTLYRTGSSEWLQVDDRVACSLRTTMAKDTGKRVLKSDVLDVIRSDFARCVHPVRDYVRALPPWDGRDRVAELCSHVKAEAVQDGQSREEAQDELLWALHKWLVAAVATWMSDDVSNHGIFVLIGRQGIYKTTFFRHLLPPELRGYFWENAHNAFNSKDDHLALAENCLVEIEEVDMSRDRDIAELKALATAVKVKERRPYGRFAEEKHRLASFCATGNQEQFLSDETGNRRWLCHKVSHIDDPREWDLDYDQLYAQLWQELSQGFRHWFDIYDQERVERQNRPFTLVSDEEQLIRTRLRIPRKGEAVKLMSGTDIAVLLNGGHMGPAMSSRKVSMVMRRLGFRRIHNHVGWFYEVYVIPFDQIQAHVSADVPSQVELKEADLPF